jgi:hypothetical protein
MDLKLETPEGIEVPIEHAELSDSVQANLDSFNRTQANPDAAEDDKHRPPLRAVRGDQLQADDATQARTEPAKRGRPRKEDAARTTAKAPDPKKQTKAVKAQTDAERREGVKGLVQVGSTICLIIDQRTPANNVSFKADAYTLTACSDQIADAVVETAKANEGFARAVDKITAAGPYAAIVGVVFGVGMQLAANHGLTQARLMGAADPRDVVAAFESQAA